MIWPFTKSTKMQLPRSITLVSSSYWLDGGTTILSAITDRDCECTIRINQRVFDSYGEPGRLFFNDELISLRSTDESRIVELLRNASIEPNNPRETDDANRISKNALILSPDIKEVMENSPDENLRKFRDDMIAYLESDEYAEIATNGLPKRS